MARVAIPLKKGLNAEEGLSDHKTCLEELVSLHLIDVSDFAGTDGARIRPGFRRRPSQADQAAARAWVKAGRPYAQSCIADLRRPEGGVQPAKTSKNSSVVKGSTAQRSPCFGVVAGRCSCMVVRVVWIGVGQRRRSAP